MANNIGYSFEIKDNPSWLRFKNHDGIVFNSSYQSGHTSTVYPSELELEADYNDQNIGINTVAESARTATIIFTQDDTNEKISVKIKQLRNLSGITSGDTTLDNDRTYLIITAATDTTISSTGGNVTLSAMFTKAMKQEITEYDKYGNITNISYIQGSATTTENVTSLCEWSSNSNSVTVDKGIVKIGQNSTSLDNYYTIFATYSGYSASTVITQEGYDVVWKFTVVTNAPNSSVIFLNENNGTISAITATGTDTSYSATCTVTSSSMPMIFGYVQNNDSNYQNGVLKLYNENNNLQTTGGAYIWDKANQNGDTLQITGIYTGNLVDYKSIYTKDKPMQLTSNNVNNIILSSITSAVTSNEISGSVTTLYSGVTEEIASGFTITPTSGGSLLNINVPDVSSLHTVSAFTQSNDVIYFTRSVIPTTVTISSMKDTSTTAIIKIRQNLGEQWNS